MGQSIANPGRGTAMPRMSRKGAKIEKCKKTSLLNSVASRDFSILTALGSNPAAHIDSRHFSRQFDRLLGRLARPAHSDSANCGVGTGVSLDLHPGLWAGVGQCL